MTARRVSAGSVLVLLAALVAVAAVAATAAQWGSAAQPRLVLLVFGVAVAVGEFLRLQLPGDREAAPIGTAAALAFALLPEIGNRQLGYDAATVVAVVTIGTLVGVAPHAAVGRAPRLDLLGHRLLATTLAAIAFRELSFGGRTLVAWSHGWDHDRWVVALVMTAVVLLSGLVDAVLAGLARAGREHGRVRPAVVDEVRAAAGLGSAIGATGVLIALAARPMGLLAVPVFLAPLLLTQFAVRRYATVRATYRQTVRSLARLTELGGYTESGHTRRVADLSMALGRDLGLTERELLDLEYAAFLHDIGQLSLTDPIPGGATVVAAPVEQRRIADLGAAIVRQTGVLDRVAQIVESQTEQYRRIHEADDGDVPLASRIIKVANAYDDLVGDSLEEGRRLDALERIHLGLAYEYDPRVVTSLTRVLARRRA